MATRKKSTSSSTLNERDSSEDFARSAERRGDEADRDDRIELATPAEMAPFVSAGAELGLEILTTSIQNWRRMTDMARNMVRMQQDAFLDMAGAQCNGAQRTAQIPDIEPTGTMQTAAQAYSRVSKAWLDVQRSALESLTQPDLKH